MTRSDSIEDRLASWFDAEVERAGVEVGRRPLRARQRRGRGALSAILVGVVVVAVVAVAPIQQPSTNPGGETSSPAPSEPLASQPSASAEVEFGQDGLPTSIGGERVLRPAEAASALAERTTADRILVVGQVSRLVPSCPLAPSPPPEHELAPRCGAGSYIVDPRGGSGVRVFRAPPIDGTVVIRLHIHDADAETCHPDLRARCRRAAVFDELVWEANK